LVACGNNSGVLNVTSLIYLAQLDANGSQDILQFSQCITSIS